MNSSEAITLLKKDKDEFVATVEEDLTSEEILSLIDYLTKRKGAKSNRMKDNLQWLMSYVTTDDYKLKVEADKDAREDDLAQFVEDAIDVFYVVRNFEVTFFVKAPIKVIKTNPFKDIKRDEFLTKLDDNKFVDWLLNRLDSTIHDWADPSWDKTTETPGTVIFNTFIVGAEYDYKNADTIMRIKNWHMEASKFTNEEILKEAKNYSDPDVVDARGAMNEPKSCPWCGRKLGEEND